MNKTVNRVAEGAVHCSDKSKMTELSLAGSSVYKDRQMKRENRQRKMDRLARGDTTDRRDVKGDLAVHS